MSIGILKETALTEFTRPKLMRTARKNEVMCLLTGQFFCKLYKETWTWDLIIPNIVPKHKFFTVTNKVRS